MIETYRLQAEQAGPHILFLGGVHGNETCGPEALGELVKRFQSGELVLQRGSLTIAPICNPKAYAANVRQIDENLNRVIGHHADPSTYEQQLANIMASLIDACDILVDFHSTSSPGVPFCFLDIPTGASEGLVKLFDIPYVITGWPELFVNQPQITSTDFYAIRHGKAGTVLECGQSGTSESANVATKSALNVLRHYKFIDGEACQFKPQMLKALHMYRKQSKRQKLAQDFYNFQKVKKGEVLIKGGDMSITSPNDAYVLFCNGKAFVGAEMLYLGVEVDA